MATARFMLMLGLIGLGCSGQEADGGASNTPDIAVPGSCDALQRCCQTVPAEQQAGCFGGAAGDELQCTLNLRGLRANGNCR